MYQFVDFVMSNNMPDLFLSLCVVEATDCILGGCCQHFILICGHATKGSITVVQECSVILQRMPASARGREMGGDFRFNHNTGS